MCFFYILVISLLFCAFFGKYVVYLDIVEVNYSIFLFGIVGRIYFLELVRFEF